MATVDKVNDNGSVYDIADSTARGAATSAETLANEAKTLATKANNKLKFNAKSEFPVEGTSSTLYIATDENKIYVWNSTNSEYDELTSSADTTEIENRLTELEDDNTDNKTRLDNLETDNINIKNDIEDIEDKIVDLKAIKSGTLPISFTAADETEIPFTIYGNNEINSKTITGVLPLTFTAKSGTAVDWVIEGNDENGTENFFGDYETFPSTHIANVNAWTSYDSSGLCQRVKCEGNTEYTLSFANTSSLFRISASSTNDVPTANNPVIVQRLVNTTNSNSETFTTPNNAKFIIVQISYYEQELLNSAMLVKGSTAPDHYIPYQQGVGERTKNLFDKSNAEMKGHFYPSSNNKIAVSNSIGSITVPCEPLKTYTIKKLQSTRFQAFTTSEYPVSNGNRSDVVADNTATSLSITSRSDDHYLTIYLWSNSTDTLTYDDIINTVVVVQDSTAPQTYIPYGYQIPLTISQQGQPDKTYDIYIGDSPLTEGETISKTSTGVDIELFEGENTVSTTLYNKPETSIITYTDYIGVGEYENGQWQIPLTLNDSDIIVPIDAPLVEGESVNGTFTSVIGDNTLDTTLSNKPNVDIGLSSRINIIENNLTTINDRLTNSEDDIATLSGYISTMSEQITTMAADIEELKSKSNPVNGYIPISVNSFMSTNTTVEEVTE